MIISMDAKKASGKIQQRFMIKTLQKVGKEETYFNIIKAIRIREEKELKGIQIGIEEVKLSLFADDIILYIEGIYDLIPVELFQIRKDDAVKVLHSIYQETWKTQQWRQYWKRSVFIPISKKSNAKECSNYSRIALISHVSKITLNNSPSQASIVDK